MTYDYKFFAEHIKQIASIVSVEVFPDGTYGNIRLVTANEKFLNMVNSVYEKNSGRNMYKTDFIPDQPYEKYIPKDHNFEDLCYRSAILGETLRTYIHPERMPTWMYITAIPLNSDKENIGYCAYLQKFTEDPDYSLMTNISPDTASQVLDICMKLRGTNDFMTTISDVIMDIRNISDSEHCCILLTDFSQRKCSVLCEALSKDTKLNSMKKYVDDDFIDIADTWHDTIGNGGCAIIKDEQDWAWLKTHNPVWYDSITPAGAKSIVLFPLKYREETIGFIWAINFNTDLAMKIKELLELSTFFLASEIANHQLFSRLEILSTTDMLTGVLNRNAMNNRVDRLITENSRTDIKQSVGIIFADLNGLKQVNDSKGHFTGDLLLKDAALSIQKHFPDNEIYRAGGDEFMVLAMEMTKDEFIKRASEFRDDVKDPDGICFAVGWAYDTITNISRAMHVADVNMYADKQHFYELHPERKKGRI